MPDKLPEIVASQDDLFIRAILQRRVRQRKVEKARRRAEEITYLNIVALMDLMTIILVFLLKSVSFATVGMAGMQNLSLPYSTVLTEPLEATKVLVTKDAIFVEDVKVAEIKDDAILPQYLDPNKNLLIPNLKTVLDKKAEKLAAIQTYHPNLKVMDHLAIVADKDTPYFVLMQVLATSAAASSAGFKEAKEPVTFGRYRLTVLRKDM
jgi:biopolymer transport protein ExbD